MLLVFRQLTLSKARRWLFLAVFLAGCAGSQKNKAAEEVMWPLPPEPTRIKFVRSYSADEDVEEEGGFFAKLSKVFAGKKEKISLKKPFAIHADKRSRIFVGDAGWGRVFVFDQENHKFEIWGESGPGALAKPTGITSDKKGNIYVSDAAQMRVVCFSPDGEFIRAYGRAEELKRPSGITLDKSDSKLYVVDTKGHQVVVFDVKTTKKVTVFGEQGNRDGDFNFPTNIAISPDNELYVMDTLNFRIQVFSTEGKFIRKFGENCDSLGCFPRSKGIGVDTEGHVYIADSAFNIVQIVDKKGQPLLVFGGAGHGPGMMWLPAGLFVDGKNRIYLADQYNYRISVYEYVSQPKETNAETDKKDESSSDKKEKGLVKSADKGKTDSSDEETSKPEGNGDKQPIEKE